MGAGTVEQVGSVLDAVESVADDREDVVGASDGEVADAALEVGTPIRPRYLVEGVGSELSAPPVSRRRT